MGALYNRSVANKTADTVTSLHSCKFFSQYGAAIYGMLMRRLGCEKLSEEILIKTFLSVKALETQKDFEENCYFRKLLTISMSMATDCKSNSVHRKLTQEKSLEGLLGKPLSSGDDKYALGREIRNKLSSFRKG
jgi:hypothetical protein